MTTTFTLVLNGDRLNHNLAQLAKIGKLPQGGVRRLAYSPEDLMARQLVQDWMVEAGMSVRVDAAGNIIGTYAGEQEGVPTLATGSHVDTVPSGGRYDGALGVVAGIEVVRVLRENNVRLAHPLEVIVFTDEEGAMIGSKAMSGTVVNDPEYYRREDGTSIQTCLKRLGGNWEQLVTAQRNRTEIAAFVELHVEQGGVLDSLSHDIGIVEGVVSQHCYAIAIIGRPNHAGTTPMHLRRDALVAASHIVLAVQALAKDTPGEQVATVGALQVWPNAANIVPGQVEMTVDIRDLSLIKIEQLVEQLEQQLRAIASTTQTEITMKPILSVAPTPAVPQVKEAIATACQQLGLSYSYLPSRASHDAQEIGRFTDMGIIFVPSAAGISHSEDEYTSPEQCTQGANVLLQTLLQLDKMAPATTVLPDVIPD
ncbi:MAG: Zn-dependent hydrolase [Coleofasciculus sp. S288]|nr:Zn-dependent hydrolase [Coleofasciculus sp. S288]